MFYLQTDDEAYQRGYDTGQAIADWIIGPGGLLVLLLLVIWAVLAVRRSNRRHRQRMADEERRLVARARDLRPDDL